MTRRSHRFTALTIAVVTYNSADHIDALLDSIPAATVGLTTRIVVVDNASTDGTIERVRGHRDVLLIAAGGNTGYSGGINVARRYAIPGAPFAVLNPDLVVAPDTLSRLVEELESDDTIGVAVPRLSQLDGVLFRHLRREPTGAGALGEALFGSRWARRPRWLTEIDHRDDDYVNDHDVDWAGAALWVISPECNSAVGEWDAGRYFLFSEETDYAFRARKAGFRIRYVADARAVHEGGGSGTSSILVALLSVNRIRHVENTRGFFGARLFRAAVVIQHLLRVGRRESRLTLRFLLSRRLWPQLPKGDPPAPHTLKPVGVQDGLS
jgi:N-acetylglucosaminyl-diphospho-decaprenol L-rhamnosyltransferase